VQVAALFNLRAHLKLESAKARNSANIYPRSNLPKYGMSRILSTGQAEQKIQETA